MYIPCSISQHLPDNSFRQDDVGCSEANVLIYADRVLKIEKECNNSANEHAMLTWLQGRLPVPKIIAAEKHDDTRYLLMSRVEGEYLCSSKILDDQERLAELVAAGLKLMWAVDISTCPTDRTLPQKFLEIEEGLRCGSITKEQAQPETYGPGGFESPAQLFDWLIKNQPAETRVLTHGDYCLPNIFADDQGITGFIDLGYAGIGDPWIDIEKVLWSMWANTTGQFGGKFRPFERGLLFSALNMQPDEEKLRYYSLLSELC